MIDLAESDDFHDSNLLSVELDLNERVLVLRLAVYLSQANRERTHIALRFWGVRNFSTTADLVALQEHARFGNVAHWTPSKGFNLISLAAGGVSFDAEGWEACAGAIDNGSP